MSAPAFTQWPHITPYIVGSHCSLKLHTFPMEEDPITSCPQYPPGIRFHPSDQELISYYLERKVKSLPLPADVITDIELYNYNPWDLPRKTLFGEDEWYFFTPRDRKYPKGGRPNRTAASGYWKATGTDKPIFSSCGSRIIGVKKGLVFYKGKPLSGHKMDWIMTEYRLPTASQPSRSKGSMRLDDWVLCRVRMRQKGNMSKNEQLEDEQNAPPPVCVQQEQDRRDVLADYVQSSEHRTIVSLLVGHDPRLVNTISQSQKSENSNRGIDENRAEKMSTHEADFYLFSDYVVPITNEPKYVDYELGQMVGTKSCYQEVMEGNKCKPNYPSNAYINYLQELDMPPLEEDFLQ